MSRTIYAVSSGEYSDYRVGALFDTQDDANAYRRALVDAEKARYAGWSDPEMWARVAEASWYIEDFELYEAGEVPVLT